jgi:hypothetical protein
MRKQVQKYSNMLVFYLRASVSLWLIDGFEIVS